MSARQHILGMFDNMPEWSEDSRHSILSMIDDVVAPDVTGTVVGHGFPLAGTANGVEEIKNFFGATVFPGLASTLDPQRPQKRELIRVIGGSDSPYIAVEIRITATAKTGTGTLNLNPSRGY
jgi:hypothetical protein